MERIGRKLKQLREEKGITVEEISSHLKISRRFLIYVENCEYHKIGGIFYLKGIIKQYASYVGMNPDEAVKMLEKEITPSPQVQVKKAENNFLLYVIAILIFFLFLVGLFLIAF